MLQYNRSFVLQASHFNGPETYELAEKLLDTGMPATITPHDVLRLLRDCHGHNFKISVELKGHPQDNQVWLLQDEEIEAIVNRYNRTNLSVHEDFIHRGKRVTTEMVAFELCARIRAAGENISVMVTVHETDEISASYSIL